MVGETTIFVPSELGQFSSVCVCIEVIDWQNVDFIFAWARASVWDLGVFPNQTEYLHLST